MHQNNLLRYRCKKTGHLYRHKISPSSFSPVHYTPVINLLLEMWRSIFSIQSKDKYIEDDRNSMNIFRKGSTIDLIFSTQRNRGYFNPEKDAIPDCAVRWIVDIKNQEVNKGKSTRRVDTEGKENMNREISTYAPIISLVSNSTNSRPPINFNDSISKGRNKIACNNNGGSWKGITRRSKALIDTRRAMRIHVCISVAGIKIANKITKSAYKRFRERRVRIDSESMREKCKWCDRGFPSSYLVTWYCGFYARDTCQLRVAVSFDSI